MKNPSTALCLLAMTLAGCNGGANPLGWFSNEPTPEETAAAIASAPLVAEVTRLEVDETPGGVIITATGMPPTQGWWNARLVAENGGVPVDGVLTYRFIVEEPPLETRVSTPQSRQVTAATSLSNIALQEVGEIVVLGTQNSRSSRR